MEQVVTMAFAVGALIVIVLSLLFTDSLKFLQQSTTASGTDGKCPQRCCKSCMLNIPMVLVVAASVGAVFAYLGHKYQSSKK